MSFQNDNACLKLYKESLKGKVQDFIISFNSEQADIDDVLQVTLDLFECLIKSYETPPPVQARLVAKVKFLHINALTGEIEERFYHFTSFSFQKVFNFDIQDFYKRHMNKIASRLETFHKNGSNLIIKNIEHIHICLQRPQTFMQK